MIHPTAPLVVLCLLAAKLTPANALVNGDFEKGLEGWKVWGASLSGQAHAGKASCEVRSDTLAWAGVDQVVEIPAGMGHLVLTGWLMSEGIRQGPEDWNKGRLGLDFLDERDSAVGGHQMVAGQVRGKLPWTRMERTYAIPAGARKAKVLCALANARGTLRCDDLSVEFTP
jgi:hypothetical protein